MGAWIRGHRRPVNGVNFEVLIVIMRYGVGLLDLVSDGFKRLLRRALKGGGG